MVDLERPRDLGQILNACWLLYRRHFTAFAAIALAVVVPMDLVSLGLIDGYLTSGFDLDKAVGGGPAYSIVQTLITVPLVSAGHVFAVMRIGRGEEPSPGESLSQAGGVLPVVLGTVLLSTLGVLAGIVVVVLPGIYLAVRWFVASQSVVAEGRRPVDGLRRSGELVRGSWWRVFGISIAFSLVAGAGGALVGVPIGVLAAATDSGAVLVLGHMAADAVILSFTALGGTLLFFDLRARSAGNPTPEAP